MVDIHTDRPADLFANKVTPRIRISRLDGDKKDKRKRKREINDENIPRCCDTKNNKKRKSRPIRWAASTSPFP